MDRAIFQGLAVWGAIARELDADGAIYESIDPGDVECRRGAQSVAGWLIGHAIAEAEGTLDAPDDLDVGEVWRLETIGVRVRQLGVLTEPEMYDLGVWSLTPGGARCWRHDHTDDLGIRLTVAKPDKPARWRATQIDIPGRTVEQMLLRVLVG